MARSNDQLVAPSGPAVVFATQQAADQISQQFRTHYESASHYAVKRGADAIQINEEIKKLQVEVNDRLARIEARSNDMRQAEAESQNARDVAKGLADLLAVAGVQIPPYGGELSHNPEGAIRNFESAHDELDRGALS